MMMTQYIIEFKGQSVAELIEKINELNGLALSELRVMDLVFDRLTGMPIRTGNGVYIFKNLIQTYYVGNCVARNFVERIPAHFDIRHNGWFNSLLKAIIKNNNFVKKEMDSHEFSGHLETSAKFAFENLSLILINFPNYNKDLINNIENLIAKELKPINTRFKKIKPILNYPI